MKIVMLIEEEEFELTLCNTKAAKQLYERLPITLSMTSLHDNEQYAYVDESFTQQAKSYHKINVGDFMLFGSSCIVLFYKTISTSFSYTPLAHVVQAKRVASLCHQKHINIQLKRGSQHE